MMKRLLLLMCISIVSQVAVAQWHYSVSVTTSGCGSLDKSVAESQVRYWMGEGYKTFSNKNECEQSRMFVMSQSYSDGSCRVKYIASPCTGPVGSTGNANVFNSNNGSSFYSTNPVNEINDWSNDYVERMLALNPEYVPKEQETVATGDPTFDNIIENMPYSDKDFSGRMPRGNTGLIKSDGEFAWASGQAVRQGISVPDDFTSRPFDYGLGAWSSDDLKPINVNLKPVPNGVETFDEEGWEIWRDGLKLGVDMGKFVAGATAGAAEATASAAISTAGVAAALAKTDINLFMELYKAKRKIDLDESYEAPDNILTEAAVYWGGKEYAIVGNVLYNAWDVTVNDFKQLIVGKVEDKVKGKVIDEVRNNALRPDVSSKLPLTSHIEELGNIGVKSFDLTGRFIEHQKKNQ